MIEKSKEEQADEERRQYYMRQQLKRLQEEVEKEKAKNRRIDNADELSKRKDTLETSKKETENTPISKSLAETAILALKLGDKIMQLYESVEPYVLS